MYVVILAGGSGTRLWPLSREHFPKQYLALEENGASLFQETVARVQGVVPAENILVVTHCDQAAEIRRQLSMIGHEKITLLEEPRARNTAPAIGLAACYLQYYHGPEAVMAVLPSDHLIRERSQFAALLQQGACAAEKFGLVTIGIQPDYPETGYGYIRRGSRLNDHTYRVERFVEKPDLETARLYLQEGGYLWNSGMFVFQVGPLLDQFQRHLPAVAASLSKLELPALGGLETVYNEMESISIDYGILEKAAQVTVIPTGLTWSDVGSWEAYHRVSDKDETGNCLQGEVLARDTRNSLVIARSRLTGVIGAENLVVIDTDDALLVCSRDKSQDVKALVDELKERQAPQWLRHRTIYRPWGSFTGLAMDESFQVKRITVNPGARLSLQSHRYRSEHWVVVKGEALVTLNEDEVMLKKGESVYIPVQARHRLHNTGTEPLELIEVQNGSYLGEDDIERYADDYGRIAGEHPAAAEHTAVQETDPAGRCFQQWLNLPDLDDATRAALREMRNQPELIREHFGATLAFGTGGMRGVIGPGLNRINIYVVRRATQGLADYINLSGVPGSGKSVAIAYDTRAFSREFAEAAALVLAANGIKALLFDGVRPTPELSFTIRQRGCAAGIVITASHNPPQYNGYKVYGPDGGQAVSPFIDELVEAINAVDLFSGVRVMPRQEAEERALLEMIGAPIDRLYLEAVRSLSLSRPRAKVKVVYTALHGTGAVLIPPLLRETGYVELTVVEAQMVPDPGFSTVKVPNPEEPASFALALEEARRVEADLVLATDPDGDRVGCAVRDERGDYVHLTGNQAGALLLDYILGRMTGRGTLPSDGVMVKTIVTGDLGRKVADAYGIRTEETLTGFKFIGEKIKEYEAAGAGSFLFGYEESYGYLAGTFARDKDAVGAAFLLAEAAAYCKERGQTLLQVLEQLSRRHGYFREDLVSLELKDMTEADRLLQAFEEIPAVLAGLKPAERRDYDRRKGWNLLTGEELTLTLPRSKVLYYRMDDGSWFCIRPSGTEPKIKIYFSVCAAGGDEADRKLQQLKKAVLAVAGMDNV
ncbi:MAG: mannose-1-phosphate guanylyltransferase/mannose-6-phosphate isomerase [Bacillota bacterium]